jgi:Baseplate J-like protein
MADPNRGRVPVPNLDDRMWADIVAEAKALIPTYAPQWTDYNASDLGITLIELFAWLVEGLTYRLNLVPDKNYIAFLNLLGITRDPATPAQAFLTFTAQPGGPVPVPKGQLVQTQGTETQAPVIFETDADLTVLPVNMTGAVGIEKGFYRNVATSFTAPPALPSSITVPASQSVQLAFGFDQLPAQPVQVLVQLFTPLLASAAQVSWVYSTAGTEPGAWPAFAAGAIADGTNALQGNGVVTITPPANWVSQAPSTWQSVTPSGPAITTPYFWFAARIHNLTSAPVQAGISWVLFNAVQAHNALTIRAPEPLGTGDGTAFQLFQLQNQPLYRIPGSDSPYSHLVVQVGGVTWNQVDDFAPGPGQSYRVDPVAGEVSFGSYDPAQGTGNGARPAAGSQVTALTYRYVAGGANGNVGAGAVSQMRLPVAGISQVQNLFSPFDGADAESIDDTKRRAPSLLRNRYRAVTADDYEFLAREASTDVVIVRCLAPRIHDDANQPHWAVGDPWMFGSLDRSPGNVTVIVVPDLGPGVPRPAPPKEVLDTVRSYLDKRHGLTARLNVAGPRYAPIDVTVNATVWTTAITSGLSSAPDLTSQLTTAITQYLHPVHGGLDGIGWQVGQSVFIGDLYRAIMPAPEIGYISSLTVANTIPPDYHNPPIGPGGAWDPSERPFPLAGAGPLVILADYELACLGNPPNVQVIQG